MLASDAFSYASANLRHQIAILYNIDIYFDKSIGLVKPPKSDLKPYTSYFLSRYEEPQNEEKSSIGTQCGKAFIGSHDAIVFIPPLPQKLIARYINGVYAELNLKWDPGVLRIGFCGNLSKLG